ncbi:MAG: hypothetical protein IIZ44_02290 [Muribaculaceae bacterium]|nr:hypothetical protein [Muribaculaceae bacterium]
MTNEIEKVNAYAKELEDIIQAAKMDVETRILSNYLVGQAKQKYDMYD